MRYATLSIFARAHSLLTYPYRTFAPTKPHTTQQYITIDARARVRGRWFTYEFSMLILRIYFASVSLLDSNYILDALEACGPRVRSCANLKV